MDFKPLVSIIIPTYNREYCIMESVTSILNQTYTNWELIIVDDGSTDKTIDVLKEIDDPRIRIIINDKNMGACVSRNRGIQEAIGELIAFEDSDDIWVDTKLQTCIDELHKHQADAVFSPYLLNESTCIPNINYNLCSDKEQASYIYFLMGTPTLVAKREVLQKEKFDEKLPRFQDYDLFIRIQKNFNVYYIDTPLVKVYESSDRITNNTKAGATALIRISEKYKDIIDSNSGIAYTFYKRVGVYVELSGGNGYEYFKKALHAKSNIRMALICFLTKIRLYRVAYPLFYGKNTRI